ncbi:GNAT family N-acetyltransferase [Paenibacillus dakarensis]
MELYVEPEYRMLGYGTKLMHEVERLAGRNNVNL